MTKHFVQLFTVNENGETHVRVWEVSERVFNKSNRHLMDGVGKPSMEAIVPADNAQTIADFNESHAGVVIQDG